MKTTDTMTESDGPQYTSIRSIRYAGPMTEQKSRIHHADVNHPVKPQIGAVTIIRPTKIQGYIEAQTAARSLILEIKWMNNY